MVTHGWKSRVLEYRNGKPRPLSSFPPPGCNYQRISGPPEQYDLSPLLPYREEVFAYSSSHPVYMPHPISKWSARPLSHSLYPGLRTPIQHRFSLELACYSNSISHPNKLYFPLILSYVWKFFFFFYFPTHTQTTTLSASHCLCRDQ